MLLSETTLVFMGIFLFFSGAEEETTKHACVFKGSSVNLTCSNSGNMSWFTINKNNSTFILKELPQDGRYVSYNATQNSNATLTILNVTESNKDFYCCGESSEDPKLCWSSKTKLHVADLQVKVIPAAEGEKVTLICKTSCSPPETPAPFVWYQNRQYVYDSWSPWYQELVSSDDSVKYSCAAEGYEAHRAPEVSVDSVTRDCFTVTYANGRICSHERKSVDKPCSITYPREIQVWKSQEEHLVTLTCGNKCPAADLHTAFRWYWNGKPVSSCESQDLTVISFHSHMSCAVKNHEDLRSNEKCGSVGSCTTVNYNSRRICRLEGSSVSIPGFYSDPSNSKLLMWYKVIRNVDEAGASAVLAYDLDHVEHIDIDHTTNTLKIDDLKKNNSGEYILTFKICDKCKLPDSPGVILEVTDVKVTVVPSAEVSEGQEVRLTCTTSCPLTDSTIYVWYFNNQTLDLPKNQNKHIIFNPVSSHHAGYYSCAVTTPHCVNSSIKVLTVKPGGQSITILNILKLIVLLLIPPIGFKLNLMMRRKTEQSGNRTSKQVNLMPETFRLKARNPSAEAESDEQQEDTM
ncbi:B-cell receptor CD22 [Nothobranchius furzeri]|uniref:LOC107389728-like protein n=1 Tax=Nothobranchius furzeri TaxID=105023 RepID=A0A1A8B5T5_NOTFU|nr:uncharacterized protein LOC107389728 [Nothobranchius furzeri]KAF7223651.1 putative LOC107389728-like protein [Nothobranchius furzeri]